jgi:Ca2+-binding RTX toxin-like protein
MRPQRPSSTWAVSWLCAFAVACGGDDDSASPTAGSGGGGKGGGSAAGSGGANAGNGTTSPSEVPPDFEGLPDFNYGSAPSNCTKAGDNKSDTYVFTLTPEDKGLLLTTRDGALQVNGVTCTGVDNPTAIEINGSSGPDIIVIDWSQGAAPASLRGGSVTVDAAGDTDTVAIAVTRDDDVIKLGKDADHTIVTFGDALPRVLTANQEQLIISAGPGADQIDASGGDVGDAVSVDLLLYAGAGNDSLKGGQGNDELHGGLGDDTFTTAADSDGADVYDGSFGDDSLSYSDRSNTITITVDDQANDGEAHEGDKVDDTVETLIGGSGNDVIFAGPAANHIVGGPGDDALYGGAGDDTFEERASRQGSDVVNGGAGSDTVDYSGRTKALSVTLCLGSGDDCSDSCGCDADDGEDGEKDTLVNIENVYGGRGNDKLLGSSAANTFYGNEGNDELRGEGGNDTLYGDLGNDTLFGGDGDDTLFSGDGVNSCDGGAGQGDICICSPDGVGVDCELR